MKHSIIFILVLFIQVHSCLTAAPMPVYRDANSFDDLLQYLEVHQERLEKSKAYLQEKGNLPDAYEYDFIEELVNVRTEQDYLNLICAKSKTQLLTTSQGKDRLTEIKKGIDQHKFPYDINENAKVIWLIKKADQNLSKSLDFAILPTHVLTRLSYSKDKKMLYGTLFYLFKEKNKIYLVSDVLSKEQFERKQRGNDFRALADTIKAYNTDHARKFPQNLEELQSYISDKAIYGRLRKNITYLGKDKTLDDPQDFLIAYDTVLTTENVDKLELFISGKMRFSSTADKKVN